MEKVSPYYDKLMNALKKVESTKASGRKPSKLLVQEDLEMFEGLLKKVQNHREIVTNYEIKLDEMGGRSSNFFESVTADLRVEDVSAGLL